MYQLLSVLLGGPPSNELLGGLASLQGDETPLGSASRNLAVLADRTTSPDAEREFNNLFVGVGRGELLPYASYYLTGFLNEKPLADLRRDLRARGIKASDDVKEPEDHISTLCEIMAGIITGEFVCDSDLASQKAFFDAHLAKWAALFFTDLEGAQSAVFYAPVGSLGRAFMAVEADAFAIQ
ncbi:TorD/DmsD family molecular chaperone [Marinobacter arenosus]|uniref:TorD/DmsD family molecular chaperone n=1 Tax=Marinobacter arenosus TaxID=2856822 RepID=UPI001E4D1917|nr:molecular chaperone TorD family protein [Marinobacter arenosus]